MHCTRFLALLLAGLSSSIAHLAWAAADSDSNIIFYDPDANYEAVPRIVKGLNEHFARQLPGFHLRAVSDLAGLMGSISSIHATYALVASDSLDSLKKLGAIPLLVPEVAGSVYYKKILVDRGAGVAGELQGKRIAAAIGDRSASAGTLVLGRLKTAGLKVTGALLIATSKDFDALLGLTFGQADAALVTAESVDVLRSVNPMAAKNLRTVWTSGNILRPVLVALRPDEGGAESRNSVVRAFVNMEETPVGKGAMQSLGFERWVPFNASYSVRGL